MTKLEELKAAEAAARKVAEAAYAAAYDAAHAAYAAARKAAYDDSDAYAAWRAAIDERDSK